MTSKIPPSCAKFAAAVEDWQAELKVAQADLAAAVGAGEKQAAAAQVHHVLQQLAAAEAELGHCQKTADLLEVCPTLPGCYYRLPFPADPVWQLWNGNWDDPTSGHSKGYPKGLQAFAFDFVPAGPNNQGESGKKILAARPGKVVVAVSSETGNSYGNNTVFFFKGGEFLKYTVGAGVAANFSVQLDAMHWPGWVDLPGPGGAGLIDAAVNWGNGTAYFFRKGLYSKYDIAKQQMFPGYPLPLNSSHWKGWPPDWETGVDAAINWGNGKVYFFKGGEYLRYDIPSDSVDLQYPRALNASTWPGWPSGWETGINAAVNWTFGQAFFFKGQEYIRYVMSPLPDHVDGPSRPVVPDWTGWPNFWNGGVDAAMVGGSGYLSVGNYLVIEHADGTFGVYWHFQHNGIRVKVGDTVERGDWIGLSGSTGNASTAHLHFDVRTGWDFGYPANKKELPSIPIRFETADHDCWLPRVGNTLISDNSE